MTDIEIVALLSIGTIASTFGFFIMVLAWAIESARRAQLEIKLGESLEKSISFNAKGIDVVARVLDKEREHGS